MNRLTNKDNTQMTIDFTYNMKKRRCGMISNETTINRDQNDTDINNYRSPYGIYKHFIKQ